MKWVKPQNRKIYGPAAPPSTTSCYGYTLFLGNRWQQGPSGRLVVNRCNELHKENVSNPPSGAREYEMSYLLPVAGRVSNSKHTIPNRTRAEVLQNHMRGDRKNARIICEHQRCSGCAWWRSRTPDEGAHRRMRVDLRVPVAGR